MNRLRVVMRWLLAAAMVAVGVLHFVTPAPFVKIVPALLPAPLLLVYLSGVFEIAGGLGLLLARTRRAAGWGLVALYVAVFPANINMAINNIQLGADAIPRWALWARLPLQAVLIALALWVSRAEAASSTTAEEDPPQHQRRERHQRHAEQPATK
ncbi:MAG: DoxX family membrane protein [Myxococcales bacterium]|nr:DoxX family membrane protein [Myxococcales bacterium]